MPSITLFFTTDHGQRIAAAYGRRLGLGRAATADEVKVEIIKEIRGIVRWADENAAREAHRNSAVQVEIT